MVDFCSNKYHICKAIPFQFTMHVFRMGLPWKPIAHGFNRVTIPAPNLLCDYSDVTWASWPIILAVTQLFLQQFIWANNKEMIKAIDQWPFMRGMYQWLVDSPQKIPVIQKASPSYDIIIECTTFADVRCIIYFISLAHGNVVVMCYLYCLDCVKEWLPRSLYIKRSYVQADA